MIATIAAVTAAALTFAGLAVAFVAWFYRRGRNEQSLAGSVERHAEATGMLAAQVGGLRDTLEAHGNQLTEHHWRIRALEGSK
jgi:hypothetical protein